MNRFPRWLIIAGALVLTLTNGVVLVGVASNKRQPPESLLALTEREFAPQWRWMGRDDENSGLGLRLRYRVESEWLDRKKLAALGFGADPHNSQMLGRDVLLVMELDGPARAHALETARDRLAHDENSNDAQAALRREEHEASRLFIVDAGLDQTALRQRYPDRSRYAIVKGNIRPYVEGEGTSAKIYGNVTAVRCETINVPLQFRGAIQKTFRLKVAFGSRLEPWIVSAGQPGAP